MMAIFLYGKLFGIKYYQRHVPTAYEVEAILYIERVKRTRD